MTERELLHKAMHETYAAVDQKLLEWCHKYAIHYSSTTSVTALIHIPSRRLVCAHVGDSKIILGRTPVSPPTPVASTGDGLTTEPVLEGVALTFDHKPDQQKERERIEAAGGSLTYLHGGKPFIRGGDFNHRDHAMQLNYSRAFGGKDLKMYGLSAVPDVSDLVLGPKDKTLILGSDGIWDVMLPDLAANMAFQAKQQRMDPATQLGLLALRTHEKQGSADNVTSICVFFGFPEK